MTAVKLPRMKSKIRNERVEIAAQDPVELGGQF